MLTAAVIAEYNPFHSGHAYHIAETRRVGATHIVAIMSGNYTQRGSPAIAEKHVRARAAIAGGADLVLELPLPYAMSHAQRFSRGAVYIADSLGCVDVLSFGSESGYTSLIGEAARVVDSPLITERLRELLSTGMTFAKARQTAVTEQFGHEVGDRLGLPNDILGVEYCRAIIELESGIAPLAIPRKVPHDGDVTSDGIASASYIRRLILSGGLASAKPFLPPEVYDIYRAAEGDTFPLSEQTFDTLTLPILRKLTADSLATLPALSEGIHNRLYSAIRESVTAPEVRELTKSKRYPAARIRRLVLSAILGMTEKMGRELPPYIRVLGWNANGREILAKAKNTATLHLSDQLAFLARQGDHCATVAELESASTDLYTLALPSPKPCGFDYVSNSIRIQP